jgi:hypothetical protein
MLGGAFGPGGWVVHGGGPMACRTQWGAFVTCRVEGRSPGVDGGCTIMLPLAYSGVATIDVAVLAGGRHWGSTPPAVYPVGTPFPDPSIVIAQSAQAVRVNVTYRAVRWPVGAGSGGNTTHDVCMDWEPWHTEHNAGRLVHFGPPTIIC